MSFTSIYTSLACLQQNCLLLSTVYRSQIYFFYSPVNQTARASLASAPASTHLFLCQFQMVSSGWNPHNRLGLLAWTIYGRSLSRRLCILMGQFLGLLFSRNNTVGASKATLLCPLIGAILAFRILSLSLTNREGEVDARQSTVAFLILFCFESSKSACVNVSKLVCLTSNSSGDVMFQALFQLFVIAKTFKGKRTAVQEMATVY